MKKLGFLVLLLLSLPKHALCKELLFRQIPYDLSYKDTLKAVKKTFPNRKLHKGKETNDAYRPIQDETVTIDDVNIGGQKYDIRFYVDPEDKLYKCTIFGRNAEDRVVMPLIRFLKSRYGGSYSIGDTELYYGTLRFHHYKHFKNYVWTVSRQKVRLDFGRSLPKSAFVYVDIQKIK
ncbi:hypothetical protein Geob_2586 [Geotalea daltonii FRC-32]|uniref:Uncharacterized protein n=1 Tax=Geotalea daltonii (strain DSM 22248 / JCM 15807 / FRC-32) TaxID=316067 RepID=B9M0T4_GEODF|nr:hypothetical protein Geob_2586 [Geotalea daltonii FRC-32]